MGALLRGGALMVLLAVGLGCGAGTATTAMPDGDNDPGGSMEPDPDPDGSSKPALVWNGNGFGIAWEDTRDGNREIYFARLDATGAKVGADVRVTNAPKWSFAPALVWTGSGYGLVWQDHRDQYYGDLYFARLSPDGAKLGPDIRVTNHPEYARNASIVWTGQHYGLVWIDQRDLKQAVYFARLDASGRKVAPEVRLRPDREGAILSLQWTGTEYAIAWWLEEGAVELVRFSDSGALLADPVKVHSDGPASTPTLVWTGSGFGVMWQDGRATKLGPADPQLYFARLGPDGTRLGNDVPVVDLHSSGAVGHAAMVWTGQEHGLAWDDGYGDMDRQVWFTRLSPDGVRAGQPQALTHPKEGGIRPRLVWTGTTFGLAWEQWWQNQPYVHEICVVVLPADASSVGPRHCFSSGHAPS